MRTLKTNEWIAVAVTLIVAVGLLIVYPMFSKNISLSGENVDVSENGAVDASVGGLEVKDVVVGSGTEALTGKMVSVHYTGTFTDGKKFDSSFDRGEPIEFTLGSGQVIPGWDIGISGMKVGGKRHLVIPAELAYGEKGVVVGETVIIAPNATLVFDVELVSVK